MTLTFPIGIFVMNSSIYCVKSWWIVWTSTRDVARLPEVMVKASTSFGWSVERQIGWKTNLNSCMAEMVKT